MHRHPQLALNELDRLLLSPPDLELTDTSGELLCSYPIGVPEYATLSEHPDHAHRPHDDAADEERRKGYSEDFGEREIGHQMIIGFLP
ncbi:hypothetical protein [Nonomuraea sp. NPDC049158]|uniref:hypothetical protein n=1 Tax=Nonomuraea sp. NPDC049158 TaxID=3155649 RepID=UPI0033E1D83D